MVDVKKFSEIDLYKLIGVEHQATEGEIRKSYRKKALECHPDKNPDNPNAAELFHKLQDALSILCDTSARAAYDRIQKAKRENELRNKLLDSKRQKLKSELEAREKQAALKKSDPYSNKTPEEIFKFELERIMKENKKMLDEENEILRQEIHKSRVDTQQKPSSSSSWDSSKHRIKIKWKADKDDKSNGGYNSEALTKFFNKYGDIVALLVSSKKNGSAVVELKTQDAAEMAVAYEKGFLSNPLKLDWINEAPKSKNAGATVTETDYESLILRQLRQAEERKRLIEEMMKDDQDD
jgi:DnaJ family protein C protein 17